MSRFRIRLDFQPSPPPYFLSPHSSGDEEEEEEEEEEEVCERESEGDPISSPFIVSEERGREGKKGWRRQQRNFSILDILVEVLRKSLVTCSVDPSEDVCSSIEIGRPTDVRHVTHVTFDRFSGFLGLPVELEPHLPRRVPSASASVFGVSAESMQCSFDDRGNSVPTILLLMQRHLYLQGGLQAEGIFRINAENSLEVYVRDQLNKGVVPHEVDLHCLAGLIKAWFRELPRGVLDSLTPDQVMHCNTEEECSQLVTMLVPTEAALLDWVINLMADVVQHEHHNKMNARNIAMVFAPNMTQMADPLTALVHAVQVMNFLKTLIIKTLREREAVKEPVLFPSCSQSPGDKDEAKQAAFIQKTRDADNTDGASLGKVMPSWEQGAGSDADGSFEGSEKKFEAGENTEFVNGTSLLITGCQDAVENGYGRSERGNGDEGILNRRLRFRKGMRKLYRHPVFQLSKSVKKSGDIDVVISRSDQREAWA